MRIVSVVRQVVDEDGDGFVASSVGGTDCDDSDPVNFPGNTEICDGGDLKGLLCEDVELTGTGLGCAEDCQSLDTSGCARVRRFAHRARLR